MPLRSRWVHTEGPWEAWVWLVGQAHGKGRWLKTAPTALAAAAAGWRWRPQRSRLERSKG